MKTAYYHLAFGIFAISYEGKTVTAITRVAREKKQNDANALTDKVAGQLSEYMAGKRKKFAFAHEAAGTPFQQCVWRALEQIPYGKTMTYGEIAKAIGRPKAARAVGGACHCNPIMIAVPCHRVVGSDGILTGYAGGLGMKKKLLQLEGVPCSR